MQHQMRFTYDKIKSRLELIKPLIYRHKHPIDPFYYQELETADTPPPFHAPDDTWQTIAPSTYWGHIQRNFVMKTRFSVPKEYSGTIEFYLPMGNSQDFAHPEALMVIDGTPFATVDRFHQEVRVPAHYCDGAEHDLHLHGWTGFWNWQGTDAQLLMRQCYVVQVDQPLRDFWVLANSAVRLLPRLDANSTAKQDLLTALDKAFMALDTREPFAEAFYNSVPQALAILTEQLAHAGKPMDVTVHSVGHAHIDVAWLWTLGQTRRKAARTFYTVDHLMSQYPDYRFTQSQPQLYEYIRQDYPELLDIIKKRVQEGKWELIGGMWVEADCNVSGSESLARQFLLGRQFFAEHFGKDQDSPVLWLPDVFGYSAQLPQLIKQAGLQYFFTIKIGWSQYNKLPYDSFWWQGLDGTKVLTHFSTTPENPDAEYASTYNAPAEPESPFMTWQRFKQKDTQRDLLMVYGWGDGGGGPTRDMLENITALHHFPSSPRTSFSKAGDFFRLLEERVGTQLPTWNGELYLEYHRGTYTTQARNKRANRKSEILLHRAEFLASYASILDKNYTYPHEAFTQAWRIVCLNQFHDIIPGSSIGEVYVESLQQYAQVEQLANTAIDGALAVIKQHISGETLLVNSAPFDYVYPSSDARVAEYAIRALPTDLPSRPSVSASPTHLENTSRRIELNADGDITRIYDKNTQREILPDGAIANQFQAYEDRPIAWDAWDIDVFYQDRRWLADPATHIEVIQKNGLDALKITRRIMNSTYIQVISLDDDLIVFDTEMDWQETHILLKVAFPVTILSPKATYEVQWGHVERPTHWNTSWDWAKFETVGHKWVNLSEGNYSVSLLNDCKYGHDIRDNVIRLTLLKSPTFPDPTADKGKQVFTYALYPQDNPNGSFADVMYHAYHLNDPVGHIAHQVQATKPTSLPSLMSAVDDNKVIIETIKRAEDNNGIVVRLYEAFRQRGWVTLKTAFALKEAHISNLMEENQQTLEIGDDGKTVTFYVTPFQIVTLRLVPSE